MARLTPPGAVGTRVDDESLWDDMLAGGYGAIGWDALGSLDDIEPTKLGKEAIRERLQRSYPTKTASGLSKQANQIYAFVRGAQERDLVVAMDGAKVLGVGRITGPYEHLAGSSAPLRGMSRCSPTGACVSRTSTPAWPRSLSPPRSTPWFKEIWRHQCTKSEVDKSTASFAIKFITRHYVLASK